MIEIIILSALCSGGSCVYTLAPIIVILIFILAAAGLTRGVSVFNLFGLGTLMGIGSGAGKGGSGKGLKSASAVGRKKMAATIKKSPAGLKKVVKKQGKKAGMKHLQKKLTALKQKQAAPKQKQANSIIGLSTAFYGWRKRSNEKKIAKTNKKISKLSNKKEEDVSRKETENNVKENREVSEKSEEQRNNLNKFINNLKQNKFVNRIKKEEEIKVNKIEKIEGVSDLFITSVAIYKGWKQKNIKNSEEQISNQTQPSKEGPATPPPPLPQSNNNNNFYGNNKKPPAAY